MSASSKPCLLWPALALLAVLASSLAGAQAPAAPGVTEADLARAVRSQPTVTEQDIARAQQRHGAAPALSTPVPAAPRLDALPAPAAGTPLDLHALAESYAAQGAGAAPPGLSASHGLLVFISFSLPEPTLQRLVEQAARAHAVLVVRGFINGSLRDTVARAHAVIGNRAVAFQIDPRAFDRYAIRATPSFVLRDTAAAAPACASGSCAADDAYVMTAGDVSLDYALAFMARRAPRFAGAARPYLKRLRG